MPWVAGEEVLACSLPTAEEAARVCVERFTDAGFRQGQPVGRALTFLRPVDGGGGALSRLLRRPREIERTLVLVDDDLRGIVVRVSGPLPGDLAAALTDGPAPAVLADPMGLTDRESSWTDVLAGRTPRTPQDPPEDPCPAPALRDGPGLPCPAGPEQALLPFDPVPVAQPPRDRVPVPDPYGPGDPDLPAAPPLDDRPPDGGGHAAPALPGQDPLDGCLAGDPLPVRGGPADDFDLRFPGSVPRVLIRPDWGEALEAARRGLIGRAPHPVAGLPGEPEPVPGPQLLRVLDPQLSVSKTHLAFGVDSQGLWIEDQNSTNGTAIVGPGGLALRCTPWQRYLVPDGARVVIGRRCFTVEILRTAPQETGVER